MRHYLVSVICVSVISHVSADGLDALASRWDSSADTGLTSTEAINFELPEMGGSKFRSDLAMSQFCFSRPVPVYPPESRRKGEQGIVRLKTTISSEGYVIEATIERSSSYPLLDAAAMQAVKSWRCHRPVKGGEPTVVIAIQPFNFNLE